MSLRVRRGRRRLRLFVCGISLLHLLILGKCHAVTKWFEYKTNIEVRTLTNRQPIQRYIAQGCLRWLGHLLRSSPNHPALVIYTFNPRAVGWSRPRGAPRTRWSDVLGKDLKQLGTTLMEASNIALDRSRWRSTIVARAVSTPSWQEL